MSLTYATSTRSRDFPKLPEPHEPTTSNHMDGLLKKAHEKGHPNLVLALFQDAVTAVSLLKKLHASTSLLLLKMETPTEVAGKPMLMLSFCLFCQYCSSNYPSYLNHIICAHYEASFEWAGSILLNRCSAITCKASKGSRPVRQRGNLPQVP